MPNEAIPIDSPIEKLRVLPTKEKIAKSIANPSHSVCGRITNRIRGMKFSPSAISGGERMGLVSDDSGQYSETQFAVVVAGGLEEL